MQGGSLTLRFAGLRHYWLFGGFAGLRCPCLLAGWNSPLRFLLLGKRDESCELLFALMSGHVPIPYK